MEPVTGFEYFPVEFDKFAHPSAANDGQQQALDSRLQSGKITDLLVMSHGWNNDMLEAESLYHELLSNMRKLLDQGRVPQLAGRTFAVLGVLWPSKKFADKDLIPSGAAGIVNTVAVDAVRDQLKALRGAFDADDADEKLTQLQGLLPKLDDSSKSRRQFVETCRSLVIVRSEDQEAQSTSFFETADALDVFERLQQPTSFISNDAPATELGGAQGIAESQGEAAGLADFFSGPISAARNVLNYTTYYQMKERAGLVGSQGVNPWLRTVREKYPELRIHVIGHSFGCRLVTATIAGKDEHSVVKVNSMSLLQAAFSHHAFSANWNGKGGQGFYLRVVQQSAVSGPVVITCTVNDKAVGVAYPIASLLAGQDAAGLGDKDSAYGGLGRNGAQKSQALEMVMAKGGGPYSLQKGKLHNFLADACIENHGDVRNESVAALVLAAIAAG
jgi:hypothetical protein